MHFTTTLLFPDVQVTDTPLIYEDVTVFLAKTLPQTPEYRTIRPVCMLAPTNQPAGIPATKEQKRLLLKEESVHLCFKMGKRQLLKAQ